MVGEMVSLEFLCNEFLFKGGLEKMLKVLESTWFLGSWEDLG